MTVELGACWMETLPAATLSNTGFARAELVITKKHNPINSLREACIDADKLRLIAKPLLSSQSTVVPSICVARTILFCF